MVFLEIASRSGFLSDRTHDQTSCNGILKWSCTEILACNSLNEFHFFTQIFQLVLQQSIYLGFIICLMMAERGVISRTAILISRRFVCHNHLSAKFENNSRKQSSNRYPTSSKFIKQYHKRS